MNHGLVQHPLPTRASQDFSIIQYADNTVIMMHACSIQLQYIQNLLMHFVVFTRLRVNYRMSIMVPINMHNSTLHLLSFVLGCVQGTFPFTYIGLTLYISKSRIEDFIPIRKRIERRLSRCSTLLSYGEKLQLLKSVFTSLPTFFMCSLELPKVVLVQINKYLKHHLSRKYGMEDKATALIAWEKVCLHKKKDGGMGVMDIETYNMALLLKHPHIIFLPRLILFGIVTSGPPHGRLVGSFW